MTWGKVCPSKGATPCRPYHPHTPDTEKLGQAFQHLWEARRAMEATFPLSTDPEHRDLWDKVQIARSQLEAAIADVRPRLHMGKKRE